MTEWYNMTYWYSINDENTRTAFTSYYQMFDIKAEHFAECNLQTEMEYPVRISIYESETGPLIAKFLVERDLSPVFTATEIWEDYDF